MVAFKIEKYQYTKRDVSTEVKLTQKKENTLGKPLGSSQK